MPTRTPNTILSEEVAAKELDVVRLVREGKSFREVEAAVGYTVGSGAAHKAYMRAIARAYTPPVAELRAAQDARIQEALMMVFPKVLGGDLAAMREWLKLEERLARLWGLDHADGIAERLVQIEADKLRLIAVAFGRVLDRMGLSDEQKSTARAALIEELRVIAADDGASLTA